MVLVIFMVGLGWFGISRVWLKTRASVKAHAVPTSQNHTLQSKGPFAVVGKGLNVPH
jgi:hypothetical protein